MVGQIHKHIIIMIFSDIGYVTGIGNDLQNEQRNEHRHEHRSGHRVWRVSGTAVPDPGRRPPSRFHVRGRSRRLYAVVTGAGDVDIRPRQVSVLLTFVRGKCVDVRWKDRRAPFTGCCL